MLARARRACSFAVVLFIIFGRIIAFRQGVKPLPLGPEFFEEEGAAEESTDEEPAVMTNVKV